MHNLSQLSKQQVGLRLPKYLVDEIDALTAQFSINRSDVIIEAISSYISEQKAQLYYSEFKSSCEALNSTLTSSDRPALKSLDELIDELEHTDT